MKGMNVALLVNSVGEWGEWEVLQSDFCLTNYSDKYFKADIVYEYNEQNFPTKADIKYTSVEGVFHDYVYFEYESY